MATGSEVALAAEVRKILTAENIQARLVSMPSTTVFDRQDEAYKTDILGNGLPIVAIEAASTGLWWKYVKGNGTVIGLDQFGESAPAKDLFKLYGFTVENIVNTVKTTLNKGK